MLHGGEAVFLSSPRLTGPWLMDCGNALDAQRILKPFLRGQGVNRLSTFVLTHGVERSIGGAALVQSNFLASKLLWGPVSFRSHSYREFVDPKSETGKRGRTVQRGEQVEEIAVLHPEKEDSGSSSDQSTLVLRWNIAGTRLLFLSDLSQYGQSVLANREPDLAADVVVAGLPDTSEPLTDGFVRLVHPRLVVITDAEYPAGQRASVRLRERLRAAVDPRVPILYTSDTRALTFLWRGAHWTVSDPSGRRLFTSTE